MSGLVSLVGAGPGDPGLITVTGLDRLRRADVVVYDRLVAPALLKEIRADAERLYVGKAASAHSVPQSQIADLLVDRARQGLRVVRLKGGDPFVFGRGGEEAHRLAAEGIEFEVVPGVTSAIAAAAYAGIPVTHRGVAASFAVVTGHEDEEKDESAIAWPRLATATDTLVVLMGLGTLPQTVERLLAEGRAAGTPAAAVQWGTMARQRVVTAPLPGLPAAVREAGLESPVAVVVGDVVALRDTLRWFDNRPLFGQRVLITRTREQASALAERLLAEGAEPLEFPAIAIDPLDTPAIAEAVAALRDDAYRWAVFTSANGVAQFFDHLSIAGLDARAFGGMRLAVIGTETARALRARGIEADVVPDRFVAEALLEALADEPLDGTRMLLARAAEARDILPAGLRARGARVDDVALYATHTPPPDPAVLAALEAGQVDIATFSASSTVRGCLDLLGGRRELLENVFIACIGPVTAQTAQELGLTVGLVSDVHTIDGLIAALRDHFARPAAQPGKAATHA